MKNLTIKKQKLVKVPEDQIKGSKYVAFQLVEFSIDFFGCFQKDVLDTGIDANGIQTVIDGNGWIPAGYEIIN